MCIFIQLSCQNIGLSVAHPHKKPSTQWAQTPVFKKHLDKVSSFHTCLSLWLVYKHSDVYFFFFLLVMDLLDTTVSSFGGLGVKFEEGASTGSLITVMSTS